MRICAHNNRTINLHNPSFRNSLFNRNLNNMYIQRLALRWLSLPCSEKKNVMQCVRGQSFINPYAPLLQAPIMCFFCFDIDIAAFLNEKRVRESTLSLACSIHVTERGRAPPICLSTHSFSFNLFPCFFFLGWLTKFAHFYAWQTWEIVDRFFAATNAVILFRLSIISD